MGLSMANVQTKTEYPPAKNFSAAEKEQFFAAHPTVWPKPQRQHRHVTGDGVKAFIDGFTKSESPYEGYTFFCVRGTKAYHGTTMRVAGTVRTSDLADYLSGFHVSTGLSTYYSKAVFKSKSNRRIENMLGMRVLVIDVDDHRNLKSKFACEERTRNINRLVETIDGTLTEDSLLPPPNGCVYTGRGAQLVWFLEQVSFQLAFMYRDVANFFCDQITELLNSGEFGDLQVDRTASVSPTGLCRLPGSYNTAAKCYASYTSFHDGLLDLPKCWENVCAQKNPAKETAYIDWTDVSAHGQHRVKALLDYLDLHNGSIDIGYREKFAFILASAYIFSGTKAEDAIDAAVKANLSFCDPIPEYQLRTALSNLRRKSYRVSNSYIITALDMSDEEQAAIGLHKRDRSNANRARKERTQAKRAQRDKTVLDLYHNGLSRNQIAKELGMGRNTVTRILEKNDIFSAKKMPEHQCAHFASAPECPHENSFEKEALSKLRQNKAIKSVEVRDMPTKNKNDLIRKALFDARAILADIEGLQPEEQDIVSQVLYDSFGMLGDILLFCPCGYRDKSSGCLRVTLLISPLDCSIFDDTICVSLIIAPTRKRRGRSGIVWSAPPEEFEAPLSAA